MGERLTRWMSREVVLERTLRLDRRSLAIGGLIMADLQEQTSGVLATSECDAPAASYPYARLLAWYSLPKCFLTAARGSFYRSSAYPNDQRLQDIIVCFCFREPILNKRLPEALHSLPSFMIRRNEKSKNGDGGCCRRGRDYRCMNVESTKPEKEGYQLYESSHLKRSPFLSRVVST